MIIDPLVIKKEMDTWIIWRLVTKIEMKNPRKLVCKIFEESVKLVINISSFPFSIC